MTFNLTYRTFGQADGVVDTDKFRIAIWFYVQRLFGVRNDHYDYTDVNTFLPRATKAFAKKVAVLPEEISGTDFAGFSSLTYSERVHIVILAVEARRQAALLYGLAAVMRHLSAGNDAAT